MIHEAFAASEDADLSETGETGGKSVTGRDRAYRSRESRSSRMSRALRHFATYRHE